ncbi:MAG TPA: PIN domain-containing protein [Acetobacteraceae bacterium]|jgi:predicted nucleic acid-binding protein|nr:PIN domain-containing protein [Acetobacteraceae bacterium]
MPPGTRSANCSTSSRPPNAPTISGTAATHTQRDNGLEIAAWFEAQTDRLFLSSTTIVEIEAGIAKLRRNGAVRRADGLTAWFDRLPGFHGSKVLALDKTVARVAGAITDRARAFGRDPGLANVAIAATAAVHGLLVLTRNANHFAPLGGTYFDPFTDALPRPRPN